MTKAAAFYQFWSQFLPAYEENTLPSKGDLMPEFPYITYDVVYDAFLGGDKAMSASVWYYSTSWKECNAKIQEISDYIGQGGRLIEVDGGKIWIKRGQPFAQLMGDSENDNIRRGYINIWAEYLTEN